MHAVARHRAPRRARTQRVSPTSDLLLEGGNERDGVLENAQFCLRLIGLEVQRDHAPELFERAVYVADANPVWRHKRTKGDTCNPSDDDDGHPVCCGGQATDPSLGHRKIKVCTVFKAQPACQAEDLSTTVCTVWRHRSACSQIHISRIANDMPYKIQTLQSCIVHISFVTHLVGHQTEPTNHCPGWLRFFAHVHLYLYQTRSILAEKLHKLYRFCFNNIFFKFVIHVQLLRHCHNLAELDNSM